MRTTVRAALAGLTLASAAVLVGCTSAADADRPGPVNSRVAQELSEAQAGGASPQQIAELEDAAATGEVSLEAARAAVRRTVQCIADAGAFAEYTEDQVNGGRIVPSFVHDDEVVAQQCETSESYWVSFLFQTQASAISTDEAYFEQQRPVLVACLKDGGADADPDADIYALLNQALQLSLEADGQGRSCLDEAGIDGF